MADIQYAHRLPPCPDYDMAGVESWLEDLAKEGLLLDNDTPFFGFYTFIRTAPQTVRYRLEPAVKIQGFWDGDPGKPKEEAQALFAELGWEYLTRYGEFFIYRSDDPNARELHTDPEIQAMALNVIKKRQRDSLIGELIILAVYLCFGVLRYPLGVSIAMGTPAMITMYVFFLWMTVKPALAFWKLQKLQTMLLRGETPPRKGNWKKAAPGTFIAKFIPVVVFIYLIGCSIFFESEEIELPDYEGDPPFITISDLNANGAYESKSLSYANRMRQWSVALFPVNYEWYEFASIELTDGSTVSGPLDIKYHEAISPILADHLAKELIRYADSGKYFGGTTPVDTGNEKVRGLRYQGKYGLDTVLLICDNTVIEAQILVDNAEGGSARDLWIQLMAERLIRK